MVQRKPQIEGVVKKIVSPNKHYSTKRTYNQAFIPDLSRVNSMTTIATGDTIFSKFTINTDIDGPMRESRVKRAKLNHTDREQYKNNLNLPVLLKSPAMDPADLLFT